MFDFIAQVKEMSSKPDVLGVAITKADARKNYLKQTIETLKSADGINVFESVIHLDSAIEWAQDNSRPVGEYKKSTRAAKEYEALTAEILSRISK